jgi:hypothetical protein
MMREPSEEVMVPENSTDDSIVLGATLFLLGTCLALWLAGWRTQGFASAWPRFEDDAYYYLVIARNVASGHGFTADGLSPTNGFQPLWMWFLVPIAWLTSGDTTRLLTATHGIVIVLFAASGGLLCDLLRRRLGLLPALIGTAVLLVPRFSNVLLSGMESGIANLLLVLLVRERLGPARPARTGVLVGLLMLARLDAVFVGVVLAGYLAVSGFVRDEGALAGRALRAVSRELRTFWPTVALVVPYLAWNYVEFGHVVPISGMLKTSHSELAWRPENLNPAYLGLLVLAAVGSALSLRLEGQARLAAILAPISIGLAVQALHSVVFMSWAVFAWHFALFIPAGAIGAAVVAREAERRLPRPVLQLGVACLAALLVIGQAVSISRLRFEFMGASRQAGEWVTHSLPAEAVLAMKDSGAFGFFSERRVMNLDGIANSFEYAETLCRGELEEFLQAHGVGYVAQHAVPPNVRDGDYETFTQRYPCHLPGGRDSQLVFSREREVYRGPIYRNYQRGEDRLVIWRLGS